MGDAAVRDTDNDAAVSRLSAVTAGYFEDPFARYFVKNSAARPPLINIGTYLRTWAIDQLVYQFLDTNYDGKVVKKQILSLGAGTDTRFFRVAHAGGPRAEALHKYVEVDFPEATSKKSMSIKRNAHLADLLGEDVRIGNGGTSLTASRYALLPGDLRSFPDLVPSLLELLDPALPTLVLAECLFIYLDPKHSHDILSWSLAKFGQSGLACILYDPVGLDDSFGKVMINNLKARGLQLLGLEASRSLQAQKERLQGLGFEQSFARDIRTIRKEDVSEAERDRLSKTEMLDEIEELDLLLSHYSISWAIKQPKDCSLFSYSDRIRATHQTQTIVCETKNVSSPPAELYNVA